MIKKLSIIIITRNSEEVIYNCLSSVLKYYDNKDLYEIIVVDNNSSDKTSDLLANFSQIKIILNKDNKGFAKACHKGVKISTGEYLMFLNPDIIMENNVFEEAKKIFDQEKGIAVIGPKLIYTNGRLQPSVRKLPDLLSQLIMLFKLDHLGISFKSVNKYLCQNFNYELKQEVGQVMGACFITHKKIWRRLNGFDTRFFIWFEEVDYCYRAKKLGLKVIYAPIGPVKHLLGDSFNKENLLKKQWLFISSLIKYFLKNRP